MAIYIRRHELLFGGGAAAAWLLVAEFLLAPSTTSSALAQGWPARPVRIVVPYAPGGSTDTVARITADRLSRIGTSR
jgi:tripartite-type tricarboxylate transporter receptor subunit TctC